VSDLYGISRRLLLFLVRGGSIRHPRRGFTICSSAGPLKNARIEWLDVFQEDNTLGNPEGYPVPSAPREVIVSITTDDGAFWDDWVSVGPLWKDTEWVSPPWCASILSIIN